MGTAAGLGILLLLGGSAPEAEARPRAVRTEPGDALKDVPFTPRAVPTRVRLVIAPDLRDPFRDGAPRRSTHRQGPTFGHGDLKDPFTDERVPPEPESAPADLRDPFGREPATPPERCAPATADGVEIQRPKQLKCPKSSAGPAATRYAAS